MVETSEIDMRAYRKSTMVSAGAAWEKYMHTTKKAGHSSRGLEWMANWVIRRT